MVALAGCSSGSSCCAGTGDGHCITVGVSVISGRHTNSANTATASPNTATSDPCTTYARTANAGTGTNHSGATLSGYADTGTTYTTSIRADDVADNGNITSPDSHTTTPSPNTGTDADTATGLWR